MDVMKDPVEIRSQLDEALKYYLNVYFIERDYDKTISLMSPKLHGFGTGRDEVGYNFESFSSMYRRDIDSVPDSISYAITSQNIQPLSESIGIVSLELNLDITIANQKLKLKNLRISLVFQKYGDDWLIDHKHISFPATEHGEDESYPNKELEERNVVLERMVKEKTADLNAALLEINKLAITDKLTGLVNRSKLDELLDGEMKRSLRYGNVFSVILIDIDLFKDVNDTYGHLAGDQFLKDFSALLKDNLREVDMPGRWGGEEFLVISPETNKESALDLSKLLLAKIRSCYFDKVGYKTASFGIAEYRSDDSVESLIGRADEALYRAKNRGRNRIEAD